MRKARHALPFATLLTRRSEGWSASDAGLSSRGYDATGIDRGSRTPGLSALPPWRHL